MAKEYCYQCKLSVYEESRYKSDFERFGDKYLRCPRKGKIHKNTRLDESCFKA